MVVSLPAENPADVPAVLPVPDARVPVAFDGQGSGSGPLTWGQAEIWLTMSQKGWLCLGGTLPLEPGTTVEDVAEDLRFMSSRFPSMRTRLCFDDSGLPSQVLSASGQTVLEIYDAEGEDGARELAALVDVHYRTASRDLENEWPVRMAVVRRDGVPTYLVVYSCHLVTDGFGAQIIGRDMAARDTEPPSGTEQLDLARWQHSDAGRRQSAASLRYWERRLAAVEPRPFSPSADPRQPRHWTGELSSPALNLAVRAIAGRTEADSTSVLLALYAIALGRRGVLSPAVIRPQASNRFRPGLAGMVSNLVQTGICVIETADSTVEQVVARAQRDARAAYKHAYHDPAGLAALLARDAAERGPEAAPWDGYSWAFLNDRRGNSQDGDGKPVTAEQLELASARSAFRWSMKKDNPFEPLYLHIHDTADAIVLTMCADTHYLAPATIEGLARDMEAVAVAAALDPAVPVGMAAAAIRS
jgi:hypothetical protein